MKEKIIEDYLRDQVKAIGGKAYKFVSPGNAGVPDRLVCLPGGKVLFVELKGTGRKSTPLQTKRQQEFIKLSQLVYVADSKNDVDSLIKSCKELMAE